MMCLIRWLLIGASAALVGCSNINMAVAPEEIVGERAIAQANAVMVGDFDTGLGYMTPSYRESARAKDFKRSRSGATGWTNVDLKWVKCDDAPKPTRCEVRLLVTLMRPPAITTPITVPLDDVWIFVDDDWYQYR